MLLIGVLWAKSCFQSLPFFFFFPFFTVEVDERLYYYTVRHAYIESLFIMQNVHLFRAFLGVNGTAPIARTSSKERDLLSGMPMLLQLAE